MPTDGFYPYNPATPLGKDLNPLISKLQQPKHVSGRHPDPGGLGSVKLIRTRDARFVSVVPSLHT